MRNYRLVDVAQRSPEWFAARLGRVTGSTAGDMLAKTSKGWSTSRQNLKIRLALERITAQSQEDVPQTNDMRRGVELEPVARRAYEAQTGRLLTTTGFLAHTDLMAGVSLDGHVGDVDGIVDFKCPKPAIHYGYIRSSTIPHDYYCQLLHGMWMTGALWAEMVSYCPQFPEPLRLHVRRVLYNTALVQDYEASLRDFLREVDVEVDAIRTMAGLPLVLEKVLA